MIGKISRQLGRKLKISGTLLVTAESCTGGWVAQAVTSVAGASGWFERGYVAYSNAAKRGMLGVPKSILERYGAVSEQTARAMALGAILRSRGALHRARGTRRRGGGIIALAITGVAGPAGGTPGKPVGTVCFAWARGGRMRSETRRFRGGRSRVRRQSVIHSLRGVLRCL